MLLKIPIKSRNYTIREVNAIVTMRNGEIVVVAQSQAASTALSGYHGVYCHKTAFKEEKHTIELVKETTI